MMTVFLLSSCQGDLFSSKSAIEDAEAFFNASAPTLSLPVFGEGTKANGEETLAYPEWKQAMSFEDGKVLEIPLRGPVSIVGEIVNYKGGKLMGCKSATRTSLVMDYRKGDIPEMFVVTILEKGKKPKYHYIGDKTEMNGFMIISELDGSIRSRYAYKYGKEYEMAGEQAMNNHVQAENAVGIEYLGYACRYAVATKGDHYPGEYGGCEYDIIYSECPFCHYTFEVILHINEPLLYQRELFTCPACGLYIYDYLALCPFCDQRLCDCTCNPDDFCPRCGLDKNMCNGCRDGYCECTVSR